MAAVLLSPAPHKLENMSNRRIPLSNVPNAANSPFRAVAAIASKRSRDQSEPQEDTSHESRPRVKRQALELDRSNLQTPPRKQGLQPLESRVFNNKRPANTQPTAFERKLLAARGPKLQTRVKRQEKDPQETLEGIRLWQKHYKKEFPRFVFYFEGIAEEIRVKYSKYVRNLGAREEKFFSKEVTHVVTTRPVPIGNDSRDYSDACTSSSTCTTNQITQPRTIDPSILDRRIDIQGHPLQPKSKFTFEGPAIKRTTSNARDTETRKSNASNVDILLKAKEMGIKVWQLEKLQRIMNTMFDVSNDIQVPGTQRAGSRTNQAAFKGEREADLSRMLRNERLNGPSDRDATAALSELIPFKGSYIYIRDMDERTKPIMVKEYPKPPKGELGEWPQFRAVSYGKCPFVEEQHPPTHQDEESMHLQKEARARHRVGCRTTRHTRAATARADAEEDVTHDDRRGRALKEIKNGGKDVVPSPDKMPAPQFCPPPPRVSDMAKSPAKTVNNVPPHASLSTFGGEPAASGLQPSNITSAIRSQMISSTAAAPGAKSGTSKEVYGLKRKVLEKNAGPGLTHAQTRAKALNPPNTARAENDIPIARQTRRQVRETLVHIDEESTQSEEDEDVWLAEEVRRGQRAQKKAREKKDPKPGYCENCREKYDDFEDHIVDRKHRKFALTQENWRDLDRLLAHLSRPLRELDSEEGLSQ